MKKTISIILVLIIMVGIFTGCGSKNKNDIVQMKVVTIDIDKNTKTMMMMIEVTNNSKKPIIDIRGTIDATFAYNGSQAFSGTIIINEDTLQSAPYQTFRYDSIQANGKTYVLHTSVIDEIMAGYSVFDIEDFNFEFDVTYIKYR